MRREEDFGSWERQKGGRGQTSWTGNGWHATRQLCCCEQSTKRKEEEEEAESSQQKGDFFLSLGAFRLPFGSLFARLVTTPLILWAPPGLGEAPGGGSARARRDRGRDKIPHNRSSFCRFQEGGHAETGMRRRTNKTREKPIRVTAFGGRDVQHASSPFTVDSSPFCLAIIIIIRISYYFCFCLRFNLFALVFPYAFFLPDPGPCLPPPLLIESRFCCCCCTCPSSPPLTRETAGD